MVDGNTSNGPAIKTFHLPNFFNRNEAGNQVAYERLGADDGESGEDGEGEDNGHADGFRGSGQGLDVGEALVAVEDARTWSHMSTLQRVLVLVSFGILGAAVLLPFNAIITPTEYYRVLLAGSRHEANFMSWIIVTYNVACIVFGAHATATMPRKPIRRRIISSSMLIVTVLLLTTILTASMVGGTASTQSDVLFPSMIALTALVAAATSYLQVAVVTLASAYGPRCMGIMLAGQGVVGAGVSVVQLITALVHAESAQVTEAGQGEIRAAVPFFGANTLFMALTVVWYWRFTKSQLYGEMDDTLSRSHQVEAERIQDTVEGSIVGVRRYLSPATRRSFHRIVEVQRKTWLACLSIAYIFVVTLAVFPSLTSRVRPSSGVGKVDDTVDAQKGGPNVATLVFVAWHFVAFNLSDLLGRSLPAIAPRLFCIERMAILAGLCLLRTAWVPLLAMCNLAPHTVPSGTPHPASFGSSTFFLLVIGLGLSNGLLATNVFIVGPRSPKLSNDVQRGLAAGLLSWWLTFGLAIGSIASFVVGTV